MLTTSVGGYIVMLLPLDQLEITPEWVAHLACALMVKVLLSDQEWEALVEDDQLEYMPSPQSKRYSILSPRLELDPQVV